jgi:hypothetical protein
MRPSAIGWVNWLVPILARAVGAHPIRGAPELWDFCNARRIFFSSHIADRFSCSAVTKLQQTEAGGMISHFINEPDHWRARSEEARNLANHA